MDKFEKLDAILDERNGYIRTADAVRNDISKTYFMDYVRRRELERVAHGIYLAADAWPDSMYEVQLRYPGVVYSHETALYLHDMAVREPIRFSVTMESGAGATRLTKEGVKVYKIKESLYDVGIMECLSPAGHALRTYDRERTICDILRSRSNIEKQEFHAALRNYVALKEKNIPQLMRYAELFSVEKIARQYMEVLLDG